LRRAPPGTANAPWLLRFPWTMLGHHSQLTNPTYLESVANLPPPARPCLAWDAATTCEGDADARPGSSGPYRSSATRRSGHGGAGVVHRGELDSGLRIAARLGACHQAALHRRGA